MTRSRGTPILLESDNTPHILEAYRIEKNSAQDEKWLQQLLHNHPECLPIVEIEPGFEMAASICMEMQTGHGPLDNLLLTPNGDIILVETKLWKSPEARRTVIAQALDYAAGLFEMDYEEFERRALKAEFGGVARPERLYDIFGPRATKDSTEFAEAVEANLNRGRALILVVGDGIRSQTERLSELVQSHAGARFTFALVELAIFKLPNSDGLLICPRTLVQTTFLERGVVKIEDHRIKVVADPSGQSAAQGLKPIPESITAEEFLGAMAAIRSDLPGKLRLLLQNLEELRVRADFQRSLHLRWEAPSGRTVNLGYISRNGELWTDTVQLGVPSSLARHYLENLAKTFRATLTTTATGKQFLKLGGKALRIGDVADQLDQWPAVVESYLTSIEQEEKIG